MIAPTKAVNPTIMTTNTIAGEPSELGAIVQVAIPAPLYQSFDYRIPTALMSQPFSAGCRVQVPFGRRSVIGIVLKRCHQSELALSKLKYVKDCLDTEAILPADILTLLEWAATYYWHPTGDVFQAALPAILRQGKALSPKPIRSWKAVDHIEDILPTLKRAPKQQSLLQLLSQHTTGMHESQLNEVTENWRPAMKSLVEKDYVMVYDKPCLAAATSTPVKGPVPNEEQQRAINAISEDLDQHKIHLVHGVTGSGKTEIYLSLAERVVEKGLQVLVLVPEISLTPQLTERFRERFTAAIAVLHSGLNEQERFCAWHSAASGHARLVIGTRSAIFTPMPDLGLIIIDEEHDGSYKQQEGFRYNARDLSLVRAKRADVPVILGSATPSLESLHNTRLGRYQLHTLLQRARTRIATRIELIDLCSQPMQEGLSAALLTKVQQHLDNGSQVMLFLNRRGYSPLLMCHECGWTSACRRCDAHMTYHQHQRQLRCHHCGNEAAVPVACADCGNESLLAIGAGTERIEQYLQQKFPDVEINRIDRDTTRKKGALQNKLQQAHKGNAGILIGTQMLAKGHDFPNVTMVGVLDTDQALFSADFRAPEHLAQLITQVSGRAGRAEKPGEVLIQTHHPKHPLLQTLLHSGYAQFAITALEERKSASLPPYQHMALLRSSAIKKTSVDEFMLEVGKLIEVTQITSMEVFGPFPAPMEKRAGRYRMQIMLQATERKYLHALLQTLLPSIQRLPSVRQVRWSIDIDPYDTF